MGDCRSSSVSLRRSSAQLHLSLATLRSVKCRGAFVLGGSEGYSHNKYEQLKTNATQLDIQVDEEAIFLEEIGGVNNNRIVYGIGSESAAYYQRPTSAHRFAAYTPYVISQLESRLKKTEDEVQDTRQEFKNKREELGKHIVKYVISDR